MFNTLKVKIIFLTFMILSLTSIVMIAFELEDFQKSKIIIVKNCNLTISAFVEKINEEIAKLENNAKDLATMGEIYYKTGRNPNISDYFVKEIFSDYKSSIGGGIWFEPFIDKKNKKYSCVYAYKNENNEVVRDYRFETSEYDYLNQSWYTETKPKLLQDNKIAWSKPYIDDAGTEALITTVSAGIYDKGKFVGMSTVDWKINTIVDTISQMRPTPNSFALFADKNNDFIIVSSDKTFNHDMLLGKSLRKLSWYDERTKDTNIIIYNNMNYISFVKTLENGFLLIINVPENELFHDEIQEFKMILLLLFLTSFIASLIILVILQKSINGPINRLLLETTSKIGKGDFDSKIDIDKPVELATLANAFNKMTDDIKNYINNLNAITKEKEKIESELSIARTIQYSVLPSTFYPDVKEFDIYAQMATAREVGGDFYDFFFINPNQFMFLIADVSGKGIPAALFMMTTKALIKNLATKENYPTKEFIERINNQICENNKKGFFVTLFAGIIDINTGDISYINCGHNPPLIKRNNNVYEYLKIDNNLVLGIFSDFSFNIHETKLEKDDILFLYTDGVTEALNEKSELYGEERLVNFLNSSEISSVKDMEQLVNNVQNNLNDFVNGIEQSDDITMVAFKYNGKTNINNKKSITLPAKIENYNNFLSWLQDFIQEMKIDDSIFMKISLVTEEIFVNVANYAYPDSEGEVTINVSKEANEIILEFIDKGVPYNPLEKTDPDINLTAEDRPIGGLGIFMVKQSVDYIDYKYENNQNILTMKFNINK